MDVLCNGYERRVWQRTIQADLDYLIYSRVGGFVKVGFTYGTCVSPWQTRTNSPILEKQPGKHKCSEGGQRIPSQEISHESDNENVNFLTR